MGDDADELAGEEHEGGFAWSVGEEVAEALDGFDDAGAVEGGEDEVPGFGCAEGELGGFFVANFSDHDHVGVLTEGRAEGSGEAVGVRVEFALGKVGVLVLEDVFDGVLEGDDVSVEGLIEVIEGGGEGGGFSRSGGTGDEDESGAAFGPTAEEVDGEAEGVERGDDVLDGANGGGEFAHGPVEVHAEVAAIVHEVAGVAFVVGFGINVARLPKGSDFLPGHCGILDGDDFTVDAKAGGLVFGEEDIGGAVFEPMADGPFEVVEIHWR